jgi:glycosyltransferase involved in cell wall biosynthesis
MRVLFVTNMWPSEERPGAGVFVAAQARSLESLGVRIAVHVIAGHRHPSRYLTDAWRIRSLALSSRCDLVHAHYGLSGWTAAWQPSPLVISFCGDDLLGTPARGGGLTFKSRVAAAMSQWVARRAAGLVCKSPNLRAALRHPEDRDRAEVIPNGVDLTRFRPGSRAEARRRLGIPSDAQVILFPHNPGQAAQKRFDLAMQTMDLLRPRLPDAELLQVSGVPHAEMPDFFRAANCLLVTSKSEGSPNVVKEALATGLPVVSVDVGDVAGWLARVTGCRIARPTADELAMAVEQVLRAGEQVDASPVLSELDERVAARRLIALYERILAGAAGKPRQVALT